MQNLDDAVACIQIRAAAPVPNGFRIGERLILAVLLRPEAIILKLHRCDVLRSFNQLVIVYRLRSLGSSISAITIQHRATLLQTLLPSLPLVHYYVVKTVRQLWVQLPLVIVGGSRRRIHDVAPVSDSLHSSGISLSIKGSTHQLLRRCEQCAFSIVLCMMSRILLSISRIDLESYFVYWLLYPLRLFASQRPQPKHDSRLLGFHFCIIRNTVNVCRKKRWQYYLKNFNHYTN